MPTRLLDYGIGAQIVADLGLHEIELLSDTPRTVVALEGYDLKIVGQRPINGPTNRSPIQMRKQESFDCRSPLL